MSEIKIFNGSIEMLLSPTYTEYKAGSMNDYVPFYASLNPMNSHYNKIKEFLYYVQYYKDNIDGFRFYIDNRARRLGKEGFDITKQDIWDYIYGHEYYGIPTLSDDNAYSYRRMTYKYAFMYFQMPLSRGKSIEKVNSGGTRYYIHQGYLAAINSLDDIEVLCCIVVPRIYIPYLRLSILLNEPIDTSIFEFWIKDDFNIPKSRHPKLRNFCKKYIIPYIEEQGIVTVHKKDFNQIFPVYNVPKAKSISEYTNLLRDVSNKGILSLREKYHNHIDS